MRTITLTFRWPDGGRAVAVGKFVVSPGDGPVLYSGDVARLAGASHSLPEHFEAALFERSLRTLATARGAECEVTSTGEWTEVDE